MTKIFSVITGIQSISEVNLKITALMRYLEKKSTRCSLSLSLRRYKSNNLRPISKIAKHRDTFEITADKIAKENPSYSRAFHIICFSVARRRKKPRSPHTFAIITRAPGFTARSQQPKPRCRSKTLRPGRAENAATSPNQLLFDVAPVFTEILGYFKVRREGWRRSS